MIKQLSMIGTALLFATADFGLAAVNKDVNGKRAGVESRVAVYIAIRADGKVGTGSKLDPFDASSPEKFDAIMRSVPANTTIRLGRGTFLTNGFQDYSLARKGFNLKKGWRIVGAGRETTIVKLMSLTDRPPDSKPYSGAVFDGGYATDTSNSLVANLTIDCNASGLSEDAVNGTDYKINGVNLQGNNCTIRNVHLIHAYGKRSAGHECFSLSISGYYDGSAWQPSYNAVIEDCLVDQSTHDYGGAIVLYNHPSSFITGVMRNNLVKNWNGTAAFGSIGRNVVIERNTAIDCTNFYYGDSGGQTDLVVRGNILRRINQHAFFFVPAFPDASAHHVLIENNRIVFKSTNKGYPALLAVNGKVAGRASDFVLRNNRVTVDPTSDVPGFYSYYLDHVNDVSVYGNSYTRAPLTHADRDVTNLRANDITLKSQNNILTK